MKPITLSSVINSKVTGRFNRETIDCKGPEMEEKRIRIADIAQELGVSTATVSNVIHGKTKKISDETVRRVQMLLEEKKYIPNMAGILLAQNNSKIIGVVVNKHEKYEGRVLEDGFIASSLNSLSEEIDQNGCFMMVKVTDQWSEIARFASMWNMEGLVIIGFCEQDYRKLRDSIRIPFVVYDGFFKEPGRLSNITADNYGGGFLMGEYFKTMGHLKGLCISDNSVCMDRERYEGFKAGLGEAELMIVPMERAARLKFYKAAIERLKRYSAVFAVSDYYAVDLMCFLQEEGICVPDEISIAGFDDSSLCREVRPALTTIHQDSRGRARLALEMLEELKHHDGTGITEVLPVRLIERDSVKNIL